MSENLKAWVSAAPDEEAAPEDAAKNVEILKEREEVSLDKLAFENNTITAADWGVLMEQCPHVEAFSAVESDLSKVEKPESAIDQIQVLDFSKNAIDSLEFVEGFPNLISLTLTDCKIEKFEQLKPLEAVKTSLQMLELNEDSLLGFETDEEMRKKVWEMLPELVGLNNKTEGGDLLEMDLMGDEEEDMDFPYEEEDMDFLEEESDLDDLVAEDEEEEDLDEDEEGEQGGDEEPASKRAKTE